MCGARFLFNLKKILNSNFAEPTAKSVVSPLPLEPLKWNPVGKVQRGMNISVIYKKK